MPSYPKGCRIPPRQEQQSSGPKHLINNHLPPKDQKCRFISIYRPPYDLPLQLQRNTVYTSTCKNKNSSDPRSQFCALSKGLDTQTSTHTVQYSTASSHDCRKAEPQLIVREYFVDPSLPVFKCVFPRVLNEQYHRRQYAFDEKSENSTLSHCIQGRYQQSLQNDMKNCYKDHVYHQRLHCKQQPELQIIKQFCNGCQKFHPCPIQNEQEFNRNPCHKQESLAHHRPRTSCQQQHLQKEKPIPTTTTTLNGAQTQTNLEEAVTCECSKPQKGKSKNKVECGCDANNGVKNGPSCCKYQPSCQSNDVEASETSKTKKKNKVECGCDTNNSMKNGPSCCKYQSLCQSKDVEASETSKKKKKNKVECGCETGIIPRFKDEPSYRSEGVECLPTKDATTCPKKSVSLCGDCFSVIDFGGSVCSRTSLTALNDMESSCQSTMYSVPIPSCDCSTSCCLLGEEKSRHKKLHMGVGACCQPIETATSTVCCQEPNISCCLPEEYEPCSTCSQDIGTCPMEDARNDCYDYTPCHRIKPAICESKSATLLRHRNGNKTYKNTMASISLCDLQKILGNDCCTEDQDCSIGYSDDNVDSVLDHSEKNKKKKKGKVICACSDKSIDNEKKQKGSSDKTCDSCTSCISDNSKKKDKKKKGRVICACSDKSIDNEVKEKRSSSEKENKKKGKGSTCGCSDKTCKSCSSCISENLKKKKKEDKNKKKGKGSACACPDKNNKQEKKQNKCKSSSCDKPLMSCDSCTSCVSSNSENEKKKRQKSKKSVSYSYFNYYDSNSKSKMKDACVSPRASTTKNITKCPNARKTKEVFRNPSCVSSSKSLRHCSSSNSNRHMRHAGVSNCSPRMSTTKIITKCPNDRNKTQVFKNPSCVSTSKSLTNYPTPSKISLSCKGMSTTACDSCSNFANSLRREQKRTIKSLSFASGSNSPLSILNSSVTCCSYVVEIPKTATHNQKVKNTRACKELVYILTEIQHGSKSNARKMEMKKKVREENETLIKDDKSMKKSDSKRATVKTESKKSVKIKESKSTKRKESKEAKDTKRKESKEAKDTKKKESKEAKDLKKKKSKAFENDQKKDKKSEKSKDDEAEAKASKVECGCKSPVCGKIEKSTMIPSGLEMKEPPKCECCFPPAFSHFSCTGTLFGNCTCNKR